MKDTAFGIRVHSGWAVLVCVSGDPAALNVVDRRRIVIIEQTKGQNSPITLRKAWGWQKLSAIFRGVQRLRNDSPPSLYVQCWIPLLLRIIE